jgi:tripartite-type tricarboxylate transporter receptor subunit TctC
MKFARRRFLHLAASVVALPALSRIAWAQNYLSRPVHVIVGFPAGFTPDIIGRLTAQWLSERLGQQFVVDNRPGAASNIATELVVKALPDGYTLLAAGGANAINATLYENLNFNFIRDIVPVGSVARAPLVLTVNPSVPAKTVPEFIADAKANPGKINMATAGKGSTPHVFGELFKMMTGVDLVTVHYRGGGAALTDLLAGRVQVMFDPMGEGIGYVRAGKLRALAVTSVAPSPALPDVPTVAEFVPGYEASGWSGLSAPKNTPAEIIAKLNQEIRAGLADAKLQSRLADLGAVPMAMTPADFGKLITDETEKWAKVIRAANIKPE